MDLESAQYTPETDDVNGIIDRKHRIAFAWSYCKHRDNILSIFFVCYIIQQKYYGQIFNKHIAACARCCLQVENQNAAGFRPLSRYS